MAAAAQVEAVLAQVDKDFDASLERLFAHLRVESISADPPSPPNAPPWLSLLAEIRGARFDVNVKPTGGHPAVVGQVSNRRWTRRPVLRSL